MVRTEMLDTPYGGEFLKRSESFARHMEGYVDRFPALVEEIKKKYSFTTRHLNEYGVMMRWGIRKLEYSFILDNIGSPKGLRVLDVGSGVTVLPNLLSVMGCDVDALDPGPSWELAVPGIAELYNSFYGSKVRYINSSIGSIRGEGVYDRVISVSVLEHLPKQEVGRTVNDMVRLLKPGGKLILTIDYCPRAGFYADFVKVLIKDGGFIGKVSRKVLTFLAGVDYTTYNSGFSYKDFVREVYPYLPTKVDLLSLKERDRKATPYSVFWGSHSFEGCLYKRYRGYLALGIAAPKTTNT